MIQPVALILRSLEKIELQQILISILVLSVSLSFHEYSHAWAAFRLGDDTAARAGRLTMNPLKHLDPVGSLVFLLTQRIGWARPVPINPANFDRRHSIKKGIVLTSAAGPLSNFLLGTASLIVFYLFMTLVLAAGWALEGLVDTTITILRTFYASNMILGLFNMLPVPPLDGFKVFGAVLPRAQYFKLMQYERYIGLIFLLIVFFGGNLLSRLLSTLIVPFDFLIQKPVNWLFMQLWRALGLF